MALKYKSPIFASEEILNDVGFILNEKEKEEITIEEYSFVFENPPQDEIFELEKSLEFAVEKEDYDLAATLRDKIEKLKEEKKNKDKE